MFLKNKKLSPKPQGDIKKNGEKTQTEKQVGI